MHHVIRRIALPLLALLALAPATALADEASQGISNGAPGGPAFAPPPPPRAERRSPAPVEAQEQADPADPLAEAGSDAALIISAQVLGGSMGYGVNLEGRLGRVILSAGASQARIGGGDAPAEDGRGLNTPVSLRYLVFRTADGIHGVDIGAGVSPMWDQNYEVLFVTAGYRCEFHALYLRGGLDFIGVTNSMIPPVPFLPVPHAAIGLRF